MKGDHSKVLIVIISPTRILQVEDGEKTPAVVYKQDEIKELFMQSVPALKGQTKDQEIEAKIQIDMLKLIFVVGIALTVFPCCYGHAKDISVDGDKYFENRQWDKAVDEYEESLAKKQEPT